MATRNERSANDNDSVTNIFCNWGKYMTSIWQMRDPVTDIINGLFLNNPILNTDFVWNIKFINNCKKFN